MNATLLKSTMVAGSFAKRGPVPFLLVAIGAGFLLTLAPMGLSMALSGKASLREALGTLCEWDSGWFESILDRGYDCQLEMIGTPGYGANVCFFPGYPLLARCVKALTGWSSVTALLVTAQAACWAFWVYVLLLLRRWRVPFALGCVGVLAIIVHPAAFFLVAGYSESLFVATMLGFIYWSERRGWPSWLAAAGHGIVLTATRIVGICVACYPAVRSALLLPQLWSAPRTWLKRDGPRVLLAVAACLGLAAFLVFCQWRFGQWNIYQQVQACGWHNQTDFLALFRLATYVPISPFSHGELNPERVDRSIPLLMSLFLICLCCRELANKRCRHPSRTARVALLASAALMLVLAISAKANVKMVSMIRYSLPIHILLVLTALQQLAYFPWRPGRRWLLAGALLALVLLAIQVLFIFRFSHGRWVA